MKTIGDVKFCDEFLAGMNDCRRGIPHKPNMPEAYDRGYHTAYEQEQIWYEQSRRLENGISGKRYGRR